MFDYELEYLFSLRATVDLEIIGPLPEGVQVNYYVIEGSVEGPRLNGTLAPVGGDWNLLRSDGVGTLDVRTTICTDDNALIFVQYTGLYDLGPDGQQLLLQQQLPPIIPLRTAPRFRTAHPAYEWLNRIQGLGIGQVDTTTFEARYDIYAVR